MADDYMKRQLPKWLRAVELERDGPRLAAIESASHGSRASPVWSRCAGYDLARAWSAA